MDKKRAKDHIHVYKAYIVVFRILFLFEKNKK